MSIATDKTVTVTFDPNSINKQSDIIGPATLTKAGAMTAAQVTQLTAVAAVLAAQDGIIIHWPIGTPWSTILAKINAARGGVIVTLEAGTYTMDVAANFDRVLFISLVESPTAFGGVPTTINMVAPFTMLGNILYLINIVVFSQVTIWDGAGPFRMNLSGSAEFSRDLASTVPSIKLAAGGVLDSSVSQFSLFGGGSAPMVEMDDGAVINFLLTAAGIIGDQTAALKLGAVAASVTAGLDSTCVVAGANGAFGNAFGAGISFSTYLNGNAFFGPYNPTTPADWNNSLPNDIGTALDRIAAVIGPIP